MENKEVVSIVIPIYNVEAYLKQCLETVVNQTYPHLEIILVNDGSPDKSEEIARNFSSKIHVFAMCAKLMAAYRQPGNTGIDLATGTTSLL